MIAVEHGYIHRWVNVCLLFPIQHTHMIIVNTYN